MQGWILKLLYIARMPDRQCVILASMLDIVIFSSRRFDVRLSGDTLMSP